MSDKISMSEDAYIIVGDLANISRAQDALRQIAPANSKEYIAPKEYSEIMATLHKWTQEIHRRIEIK